MNCRPALTTDNESVVMAATVSCTRPKLIVFDLDYTLWPFWVDTHITCPMKKNRNGKIVDGSGSEITCYPDVPNILERLRSEGYIMGVASRTEWPDGARQLLGLLDWNKYFQYQEIYPGKKTTHFQRMHDKTGVPYSEMLFFDDEQRNITDIRQLGATSILVPNGLTNRKLEEAFQQYARR